MHIESWIRQNSRFIDRNEEGSDLNIIAINVEDDVYDYICNSLEISKIKYFE
jgi:hypothetical protein